MNILCLVVETVNLLKRHMRLNRTEVSTPRQVRTGTGSPLPRAALLTTIQVTKDAYFGQRLD